MKTIKQTLIALTISLVAISCKNDKTATNNDTTLAKTEITSSENPKTTVANPKTASFEIEGMTCAVGCASLIEGKLNKLDGVTEAKVDFETKTATVTYDADKLDQKKLTKTVEGVAGGELYKVSKVKS
jgi:periplasmic mercuric ion binding protein